MTAQIEAAPIDAPAVVINPPVLTEDQAAAYLSTSPRMIRHLRQTRQLAYTKVGRQVRLKRADLDALLAAGRIEADR